jgi:hypothetical protein
MNIWLYVKLGAGAGLLFLAYHLGGNASRAALEAQHAAQMSAVATAYQNQTLALQASEAQLEKVQNAYDAIKDVPDPVSTGLAQRVLVAAGGACRSDLPKAAAVAGGTQASPAVTGGDSGIVGRLQGLIDACTADSKQMNAMIELAP